jgi:hypothetical protein
MMFSPENCLLFSAIALVAYRLHDELVQNCLHQFLVLDGTMPLIQKQVAISRRDHRLV